MAVDWITLSSDYVFADTDCLLSRRRLLTDSCLFWPSSTSRSESIRDQGLTLVSSLEHGFARACRRGLFPSPSLIDLSSRSADTNIAISRAISTFITVFRTCHHRHFRFTSSSQHDISYSDTRKKAIPNSPSYTHQPAVRASNVAALPRAGRALGHTLVSKLGLQHRHVALSTESSVFIVDGSPMLVACSLTLWLFTDRMPSFCKMLYLLCMT
jgi:hypothetical protein